MKRVLIVMIMAVLLVSCATAPRIKVSVLYPTTNGKQFDIDYYRDTHMVLVKDLLTPYGLLQSGVEKGMAGGEPGQAPPYVCIGYMVFSTVEKFQQAFAAHGQDLLDDVPNFTSIQPVIQISEIVK